MKYLLLVILLYAGICNAAPVVRIKPKDRMPYPEYNLSNYLSTNLHYPNRAREKGIEGRVLLKFIVTETGAITDCRIIKRIGGGCDEEALRVVKQMPPWKPGIQKGKPVRCWFTQPISFKLE
jgi:protein TonB